MPEDFGKGTLKAAYVDLDKAAQLVKGVPGCRERVDHLRMYAHYLYLRIKLAEVAKTKSKDAIVQAIKDETVFGARLMNTNMIHSRPLIGKAFHRRFRALQSYLAGMEEGKGKAGWGKGFRVTRDDVPTHEEIEKLWAEDREALGI